jgi:signal transduction histidine kinase
VDARQADVLRELDRLRAEIADLRLSRKRLAFAHDADRRGIEHDLHEGVQQDLVALAAKLQLAAGLRETDPAAAKTFLEEMESDVQRALDETARLAHRIYPPLLEAGGLAAALRSAAVTANARIRIEVEGGADYPPEVAGAVYFCCVEVLERVAEGSPATVTVRDEGGALAFEVVGDYADSQAELLRLRDRVEALGGRLTIHVAGRTTRVAGSLPLSE